MEDVVYKKREQFIKLLLENFSLSIDIDSSSDNFGHKIMFTNYSDINRTKFIQLYGENISFLLDNSKKELYSVFDIESNMPDNLPSVNDVKSYHIDLNELLTTNLLILKNEYASIKDDVIRHNIIKQIKNIIELGESFGFNLKEKNIDISKSL
jgi:hypothetical protein